MEASQHINPLLSVPPGIAAEEYNLFLMVNLKREYADFATYIIHDLKADYQAHILEIGARTGWLSFELSKRLPDSEIFALVFSEELLALANQNKAQLKADNVRFVLAEENDLNQFVNKSFDIVISHKMLHLFKQPENILNSIKKFSKKSGKYAISDYRSDLKLLAKVALWFNGRSMSPPFRDLWRKWIRSSYSLDEVVQILLKTKLKDWKIQSTLIDFIIHN